MMVDNRENLEEKVEVYLPASNFEMLNHLVTGEKPVRPVEMNIRDYNDFRKIAIGCMVSVFVLFGVDRCMYINREYNGSLLKAYNAFIEELDKTPSYAYPSS